MTILNIGNQAFNSTEVAEKVQHDINFLLARIEHLQQQLNPNPVVLHTYKEMLESRQAVLNWLVHEQPSTTNIAQQVG